MSSTENITTMTDVDLVRGDRTCGMTVYNGDTEFLESLLSQGWVITGIVTVL